MLGRTEKKHEKSQESQSLDTDLKRVLPVMKQTCYVFDQKFCFSFRLTLVGEMHRMFYKVLVQLLLMSIGKKPSFLTYEALNVYIRI